MQFVTVQPFGQYALAFGHTLIDDLELLVKYVRSVTKG